VSFLKPLVSAPFAAGGVAGRPRCGAGLCIPPTRAVGRARGRCDVAQPVSATRHEEWQRKKELSWLAYELIFTSVGQKQKPPSPVMLFSSRQPTSTSQRVLLHLCGLQDEGGGNHSKVAAQHDGRCTAPAFPFCTLPINLNPTVTLTPVGDSQIQK